MYGSKQLSSVADNFLEEKIKNRKICYSNMIRYGISLNLPILFSSRTNLNILFCDPRAGSGCVWRSGPVSLKIGMVRISSPILLTLYLITFLVLQNTGYLLSKSQLPLFNWRGGGGLLPYVLVIPPRSNK